MLEMILVCALGGDGGRFFDRREVDFWGCRKKGEPSSEELWADSTAPGPVKRLLDRPSAENARAYVAWQEERLRRLRAAMTAVEQARASILYFSREGCRWCAAQEEELHGLPVARVPADSPLWKEHGVAVTPTLVVAGKTFRGFTPRAALLKELGRD